MEIWIDSFAVLAENQADWSQALQELLEKIQLADTLWFHSFGIGEHHREWFLDSSPISILSAGASITKNIRLSSAVTVLSADDPVRVFQNFATLDLISGGRAEIVAGRGSFTEAYPLFGLDLKDYDSLFQEKLNLLLQIRDNETVNWSGKFRPALHNQAIYPRPKQKKLPIWLGVWGTPASFIRAWELGLPLMVAIIGGETHRFRPLIDLYREAGKRAWYRQSDLKVGLHSLGYVAPTKKQALDEYYPKYKEMFTKIGKERGYAPITRAGFESQVWPTGALLIWDPQEIAEKIRRHSESLWGISRLSFQMDGGLEHKKIMQSIELIGKELIPALRDI